MVKSGNACCLSSTDVVTAFARVPLNCEESGFEIRSKNEAHTDSRICKESEVKYFKQMHAFAQLPYIAPYSDEPEPEDEWGKVSEAKLKKFNERIKKYEESSEKYGQEIEEFAKKLTVVSEGSDEYNDYKRKMNEVHVSRSKVENAKKLIVREKTSYEKTKESEVKSKEIAHFAMVAGLNFTTGKSRQPHGDGDEGGNEKLWANIAKPLVKKGQRKKKKTVNDFDDIAKEMKEYSERVGAPEPNELAIFQNKTSRVITCRAIIDHPDGQREFLVVSFRGTEFDEGDADKLTDAKSLGITTLFGNRRHRKVGVTAMGFPMHYNNLHASACPDGPDEFPQKPPRMRDSKGRLMKKVRHTKDEIKNFQKSNEKKAMLKFLTHAEREEIRLLRGLNTCLPKYAPCCYTGLEGLEYDGLSEEMQEALKNRFDRAKNWSITRKYPKPPKPNPKDEEEKDGSGEIQAKFFEDFFMHLSDMTERVRLPILLVGHSLGGASAVLCAMDLIRDFRVKEDQCRLVTFGMPRALGFKAAELFDDEYEIEHYRLMNANDIIPAMPPSFMGLHRHCGSPIAYELIHGDKDFVEKWGPNGQHGQDTESETHGKYAWIEFSHEDYHGDLHEVEENCIAEDGEFSAMSLIREVADKCESNWKYKNAHLMCPDHDNAKLYEKEKGIRRYVKCDYKTNLDKGLQTLKEIEKTVKRQSFVKCDDSSGEKSIKRRISLPRKAEIAAGGGPLAGKDTYVCCAIPPCICGLFTKYPKCLMSTLICHTETIECGCANCCFTTYDDEAPKLPGSKMHGKLCCLDYRCMLPMNAEYGVPQVIACFGVTCQYEDEGVVLIMPLLKNMKKAAEEARALKLEAEKNGTKSVVPA